VHYGVKIRAPHALVMTFLFKGDQPIRKNIEGILKVSSRIPEIALPMHTFCTHVGHSSAQHGPLSGAHACNGGMHDDW
jgi:hypothetical protein